MSLVHFWLLCVADDAAAHETCTRVLWFGQPHTADWWPTFRADNFRCLRFLCEPIATPPVRTSSPAANFALSVGRQLIYWRPMTKETFTEWRRGAADEILPSIESMNQITFPLSNKSLSVNALFDLRYAANLSAAARQGCEWEINQTSRVLRSYPAHRGVRRAPFHVTAG